MMSRGSLIALLLIAAGSIFVFAQDQTAASGATPVLPEPQEGQYVHVLPGKDEIPDGPLGDAIRRGREIFTETQKFKGVYTYGDMTCASCHLDEGRQIFSAPIWPVATTLPDYRGKNWRVNTVEDRISDCFAYSMNGIAPESGSDDMIALLAYHSWLATGAPMYEENIYGRGYGNIADPELEPDYDRGETVYAESCAVCHGVDGQGQSAGGEVVFPPLWGDGSYNWGAGMSRMPNSANFVRTNMPLGQPDLLTDQQVWDVVQFMNSHDRPQDPRYTGDVQETRERHINFHSRSMYGLEVNGVILGDHDNTGSKPFLRPDTLRYAPLDDDD